MDLTVRGQNGQNNLPTPSLVAYDRDHINALLTQLAPVDQALGQSAPRTLLNGGMVNIDVPAERLTEVAGILRDQLGFEMLTCVTGVDMIDHIESLYHFRSLQHNWLLQVRVKLPTERPEVNSLVSLYPSANWLEREQYDLVGIIYVGHPDLRRILLEDEFMGHPLLKSFRTTPMVKHDRATTQAPPVHAVSGEQIRNQERIVTKRFGQGAEERIHPGMTTFGSSAVYLETGQGVDPDSIGERSDAPGSSEQPRGGTPLVTPPATMAGETPSIPPEKITDQRVRG